MMPAERLLEWLSSRPDAGEAAVGGWRCEVVGGEGLRAGIRDTALGGPYEGPASALRVAGSLDLHWSDGQITRAVLDRWSVLDPASNLQAWRAEAVPERHGVLPPLAGPSAVPDVLTLDPSVRDAVTDDPSATLALLARVREAALAAGARRLDALFRASAGWRQVATSRGFAAAWEETTCSLDLWADEAAGLAYAHRSLVMPAHAAALAHDATVLAAQLRQAAPLPDGARGVLFMPSVVEELVARLLLPALSGRAIRDGRSPFTRADVEAHREVIRPDLRLEIDTTRPLALASAPCSPEGVPAARVALIEAGRLVSPVLDSSTAAAFGLPPTPVARGRPLALVTGSEPALSMPTALELLGAGVIVRDLPGLHTQSARRGAYALVAPDAQVVRAGVAGGRCPVRLRGAILDHLSRASTRLVAVPDQPSPGLLVLDGVALTPA